MSFCFPSAFGQMIFLCVWGGMWSKLSTAWLGWIPTSTFATGKEVKTSNSIYLFCTPQNGWHFIHLVHILYGLIIPYHTTPQKCRRLYDEALWRSLVCLKKAGGLVDQSCWGWCSRWYFGIQVVVARCNYWGNRWEGRCGGFRCWSTHVEDSKETPFEIWQFWVFMSDF